MEVESRVSTDLINPSCMSVDQDPNPVLKFTLAGGGEHVVPPPGVTGNPGIETEREKFPIDKEKETIYREKSRVGVEEANKEEDGHWCCEWCDENVEHLQEKIWQLHRREVERDEMWKTDFSNWNFFRKEFFRESQILKMFLSVSFKCPRSWLGCMTGLKV